MTQPTVSKHWRNNLTSLTRSIMQHCHHNAPPIDWLNVSHASALSDCVSPQRASDWLIECVTCQCTIRLCAVTCRNVTRWWSELSALRSVLTSTCCCPTSTRGRTTCGRTSEHSSTRKSNATFALLSPDLDTTFGVSPDLVSLSHCLRPTPKKRNLSL